MLASSLSSMGTSLCLRPALEVPGLVSHKPPCSSLLMVTAEGCLIIILRTRSAGLVPILDVDKSETCTKTGVYCRNKVHILSFCLGPTSADTYRKTAVGTRKRGPSKGCSAGALNTE